MHDINFIRNNPKLFDDMMKKRKTAAVSKKILQLDDYLRAGENLINPLKENKKNLDSGKALYGMFCAHCHGDNGDGQGSIKHPLYGAVPSYSDNLLIRRSGTTMQNLLDGHMYHAITHGFNAMGPHASQINSEERWQIIMYVNQLQKENN